MRVIDAALGDAAQPPPPGADAFSLGDAEATTGILESAGFDALHFEDVTVARLRETLAAHYSDEHGVALDSRSWLITTRRRQ